MPLNSPVESSEVAEIHLGGFVKQTLQVANLHSLLIHKAAARTGRLRASVPYAWRAEFDELFVRMNRKAHPSRDIRSLVPADQQARREFLEQVCSLWPHSVAYNHVFDDYMIYLDDHKPSDAIIRKTRSIVLYAFF